ncbi:hypothetical protein GOP47_0000804 [Adiantum capillus-veneris]|uniref:Uncharacterized protein n=1 Tax=Adiantum capillus-veneris TaxID=13818 RepID=A0A9D4VEM5_ADICA|nr:hypothetical protein GOP47_0000804 [Adiantum capillus-veneris]
MKGSAREGLSDADANTAKDEHDKDVEMPYVEHRAETSFCDHDVLTIEQVQIHLDCPHVRLRIALMRLRIDVKFLLWMCDAQKCF